MEIAIKVENQEELELFNKMYGQEAVKAPCLVCLCKWDIHGE